MTYKHGWKFYVFDGISLATSVALTILRIRWYKIIKYYKTFAMVFSLKRFFVFDFVYVVIYIQM